MKGLELSEQFYESYGRPMLENQFSPWMDVIAVGLFGSGSECFGFDDAVSQDHDFEPGFCIFLPDESIVDRKTAFQMERAYAKLPKEFLGFSRQILQPVGGNRHGVLRLSDFLQDKLGAPDGVLTWEQWLTVPSYALAEMTNGKLFWDGSGLLTAIRSQLRQMPEDIRRKKLSGHLLLMAQSGQYNYHRCLLHGEDAAAQLAMGEFVRNTMEVIFLLNRRPMPFYKWSFRALRSLPLLSETADALASLLMSGNTESEAAQKQDAVEALASLVIDELQTQELTKAICGDLEKHAYSVNDSIEDSSLRNQHILSAV